MNKASITKFYVCQLKGCGRLFSTRFSMKRHMVIHFGKKQYACPYCDKSFNLHQYLREHIYIHINAKPYICGINGCQERFRQAGKLSMHRRTHKEYSLKKHKRIKSATQMKVLETHFREVESTLEREVTKSDRLPNLQLALKEHTELEGMLELSTESNKE